MLTATRLPPDFSAETWEHTGTSKVERCYDTESWVWGDFALKSIIPVEYLGDSANHVLIDGDTLYRVYSAGRLETVVMTFKRK
jgi:hypothetical protein